ncbi:MAG: hypothetical protein KAJ10_14105 [Thermodesulfovibrionia bacterium]|nr:hypothetical protein [Thermodesulfovibrionia bacterium]
MESNKENRKNKAKEETMKFFKIFLLLIFASLFIVACGDGGGDGGDGAGACVDSYSYIVITITMLMNALVTMRPITRTVHAKI